MNMSENKKFTTLVDCIEEIEDLRQEWKVAYSLKNIIIICLCVR